MQSNKIRFFSLILAKINLHKIALILVFFSSISVINANAKTNVDSMNATTATIGGGGG
ncbi:hypothetical protein [Helicobacter sp. T3_23-1059]